MAYKKREVEKKAVSARGIKISIACGILMGTFYPLIVKATTGKAAVGPYAVAFSLLHRRGVCALCL